MWIVFLVGERNNNGKKAHTTDTAAPEQAAGQITVRDVVRANTRRTDAQHSKVHAIDVKKGDTGNEYVSYQISERTH